MKPAGDLRATSGFGALFRRLQFRQERFQEMCFRQRTFERMLLVDHRFGHGLDAILCDQVRKLGGLNAIGRDVLAFHRELVGQANRPRTVRSRGRDKNLEVDRLAEAGKLFPALCSQARLAF